MRHVTSLSTEGKCRMSDEVQPVSAPPASMIASLPCAVCGEQSAHVELVAPGSLPAGWAQWDVRRQATYKQFHDASWWRFIYDGPAAGSGSGHDISDAEAAKITEVFMPPVTAVRVHDVSGFYDNAGICGPCGDVPYCRQHWHVSQSALGTCPRGHTKSLDPHWSPDDDEW
jgi:hypothetical protein